MATFYSGQVDYIDKLNDLVPQLSVFTPTVEGKLSAGTAVYSVQKGYYSKIGDEVSFTVILKVSSHTGTGQVLVKNLPFAPSSIQTFHPTVINSKGVISNVVAALSSTTLTLGLTMPTQEFTIKLTGRYTSG
jgi:hypothetical protein